MEKQSENLYDKSQSNKIKSEELLEQIQLTTNQLHALDNSLRSAESDFSHSVELINDCKKRIAEIERSEEALNSSRREYCEKKDAVEERVNELSDIRFNYLREQEALTEKINILSKALEEALDDLRCEENTVTDCKARIEL